MKVEQKSYAQILILDRTDFILSSIYEQYELTCPFLCFPGMFARDFSTALRDPKQVQADKDVIVLLAPYWDLLSTEEKKAILDHELGHISEGHLKKIEEKVRRTGRVTASQVDQTEEMEADAYSAKLNGESAIYHGLMRALEVMTAGYRKKGYRTNIGMVINGDAIIRNRLNLLKKQMGEEGDSEEE